MTVQEFLHWLAINPVLGDGVGVYDPVGLSAHIRLNLGEIGLDQHIDDLVQAALREERNA